MEIDPYFDFTTDTPGYWDNFWQNSSGMGGGKSDPDSMSPMLQKYHCQLWSRMLPNGECMQLTMGNGASYLTWKDFRFGSDSILASFRYERYRYMHEQLRQELPDYQAFMEAFLRKAYTMGGMIIFPKKRGSINQARGCHALIRDRWDLTLECIRRYYASEENPLQKVLSQEKSFFDLFVDFKGYVDYFFLQDCVSADYSNVNLWLENGVFTEDPLPKTTSEYLKWIDCQLDFVEKRNARIKAFCANVPCQLTI